MAEQIALITLRPRLGLFECKTSRYEVPGMMWDVRIHRSLLARESIKKKKIQAQSPPRILPNGDAWRGLRS